MKFVVGLGNPGLKYKNTRHNIGFLVAHALAKKIGANLNTKKYNGLIGKGSYKTHGVTIFLPQTYMNLSGSAVSAFKNEIRDLSSMLITYDDIDLGLGAIRVRKQGSSGGHKGMRSIIEALGTEDFPRLRVGIKGRDKIEDTSRYVLKPFNADERKRLKDIIEKACECIFCWIEKGIDATMTKYNRDYSD